jgi:MEMO1 family protein
MEIRTPNVAGTFYPSDAEVLKNDLKEYFKNAAPIPDGLEDKTVRALICPHAGYTYSGVAAASGYQMLRKSKCNKVILLGPSHYIGFNLAALDTYSKWTSPLGEVEVFQEENSKLIQNENFKITPEPFFKEHSLEVHLPFLQTVLKEFKFIPICYGQDLKRTEIAKSLLEIIDDNTLIVASSDLSHYMDLEIANRTDQSSIDVILSQDEKKMLGNLDACGREGILILNEIAKARSWKPYLIDHRTSAEASGDTTGVVGYTAIAYVS